MKNIYLITEDYEDKGILSEFASTDKKEKVNPKDRCITYAFTDIKVAASQLAKRMNLRGGHASFEDTLDLMKTFQTELEKAQKKDPLLSCEQGNTFDKGYVGFVIVPLN